MPFKTAQSFRAWMWNFCVYQDHAKATEVACMSYSDQKRRRLLTPTRGEAGFRSQPPNGSCHGTNGDRVVVGKSGRRVKSAQLQLGTPGAKFADETSSEEQRPCAHERQTPSDHGVGWDVNCWTKFNRGETMPIGSQNCLARESQDALINSILTVIHDSSQIWNLLEIPPSNTVQSL